MLFKGKSYGKEKEIHTFNHADHIAQLPRYHYRGKRTLGIADKLRGR